MAVLDERTRVDVSKCHSLLDFSLLRTEEFHFYNVKFPPVPADIHDLTGKDCSGLLSNRLDILARNFLAPVPVWLVYTAAQTFNDLFSSLQRTTFSPFLETI